MGHAWRKDVGVGVRSALGTQCVSSLSSPNSFGFAAWLDRPAGCWRWKVRLTARGMCRPPCVRVGSTVGCCVTGARGAAKERRLGGGPTEGSASMRGRPNALLLSSASKRHAALSPARVREELHGLSTAKHEGADTGGGGWHVSLGLLLSSRPNCHMGVSPPRAHDPHHTPQRVRMNAGKTLMQKIGEQQNNSATVVIRLGDGAVRTQRHRPPGGLWGAAIDKSPVLNSGHTAMGLVDVVIRKRPVV